MFSPRRYLAELSAGFAIYGALLVVARFADRALQPAGAVKYIISLLPMIGACAVVWAVLRAFRKLDELQRRIQFEAIVTSFWATAMLTFAWGFAENAGLPRLPTFAVWPIMGALWGMGLIFTNRRYR